MIILGVVLLAGGVFVFAEEGQDTGTTTTQEAEAGDQKDQKVETTESSKATQQKAEPSVLVSGEVIKTTDTEDKNNTPASSADTVADATTVAATVAATDTITVTVADTITEEIDYEDSVAGIEIDQEEISLDLKGIEINELFRILSQKMGITIVPTKNVSGRINIFLNNLSFEDALDVILISQDLACEKNENMINVMTSTEYQGLYGRKYNEKRKFSTLKLNYASPTTVFNALSQVKSDIGKVIVDESSGTIMLIDIPEKLTLMEETAKELDLAPTTEIFDINYAKTEDMKAHLTSAVTTGPGEVFIDERSSKVVISDLPGKMKKIRRMVRAFDDETKQVYIEAEILQLTLKKEFQRQINWEKAFKQKWLESLDFTGTFPVSPSFTPSPALTTASLQVTHGTQATDWHSETIKFLETFGDTKIISSPRLAVVNNQEAKILVGSREAYVTTSQSQAETTTVTSESIEFIDVGTKLNIVPTINEGGYITMKIKPEVSSVRETLTTSLGSSVPIVETSEAETVVKIKDGQTILIAGLVKDEKRRDTTGWPFFQSIPILRVFFGSRAELDKRTETIILLTPHIVSGDVALPGTTPKDVLPADIVPEGLEKEIVSTVLSREIEKATALEREKFIPEHERLLRAPLPQDFPGKSKIEIQGRFKGLKEY